MAKKKIKFKLSPTGAFKLGYSAGDTAELEEKQADELIESGYAVAVEKKKKEGDADADAAKAKAEADANAGK